MICPPALTAAASTRLCAGRSRTSGLSRGSWKNGRNGKSSRSKRRRERGGSRSPPGERRRWWWWDCRLDRWRGRRTGYGSGAEPTALCWRRVLSPRRWPSRVRLSYDVVQDDNCTIKFGWGRDLCMGADVGGSTKGHETHTLACFAIVLITCVALCSTEVRTFYLSGDLMSCVLFDFCVCRVSLVCCGFCTRKTRIRAFLVVVF